MGGRVHGLGRGCIHGTQPYSKNHCHEVEEETDQHEGEDFNAVLTNVAEAGKKVLEARLVGFEGELDVGMEFRPKQQCIGDNVERKNEQQGKD